MNVEDLFVGAVAVVLGTTAVVAAVGNWDRCYQLSKARWLERLAGRGVVRGVYALVGITLIVLGLAIALGYRPGGNPSLSSGPRTLAPNCEQPDGRNHRAAHATDNELIEMPPASG